MLTVAVPRNGKKSGLGQRLALPRGTGRIHDGRFGSPFAPDPDASKTPPGIHVVNVEWEQGLLDTVSVRSTSHPADRAIRSWVNVARTETPAHDLTKLTPSQWPINSDDRSQNDNREDTSRELFHNKIANCSELRQLGRSFRLFVRSLKMRVVALCRTTEA